MNQFEKLKRIENFMNLTSLLWSDPVGARQLRAEVLRRRAPRRSRMDEKKPAHLLLLYDDCLVTQHL